MFIKGKWTATHAGLIHDIKIVKFNRTHANSSVLKLDPAFLYQEVALSFFFISLPFYLILY